MWLGNIVATCKPFSNVTVIQENQGEGVAFGGANPNERLVASSKKPICAKNFNAARRIFEAEYVTEIAQAETEGDVNVVGVEIRGTDI